MPVTRFTRLAAAASLALAGSALAAPSFVPVYLANFPDPFVLLAGSEFLAYATNDGINLPMASSRALVHWAPVMDPANPGKRLDGMPKLGSWAKEGFTGAPEGQRGGSKNIPF